MPKPAPKIDPDAETPSAGQQVDPNDDEGEGGVETLMITPTILELLGIFEKAGEKGLQISDAREAFYAPRRGGKRLPPPIDTELSSICGGLIEQVPHPKLKGEIVEGQWRITAAGREAIAKTTPVAE